MSGVAGEGVTGTWTPLDTLDITSIARLSLGTTLANHPVQTHQRKFMHDCVFRQEIPPRSKWMACVYETGDSLGEDSSCDDNDPPNLSGPYLQYINSHLPSFGLRLVVGEGSAWNLVYKCFIIISWIFNVTFESEGDYK